MLHMLFSLEDADPLPDLLSDDAISAAINLVEVCLQQTLYLISWEGIDRRGSQKI